MKIKMELWFSKNLQFYCLTTQVTKSYNRNKCLAQYGCWYFISTDFVIKSINTHCLKMFKAYLGLFLTISEKDHVEI